MKTEKQDCRKKPYEKVTFQHKLFVVDQIKNGQISAKFASKNIIPLDQLLLIG